MRLSLLPVVDALDAARAEGAAKDGRIAALTAEVDRLRASRQSRSTASRSGRRPSGVSAPSASPGDSWRTAQASWYGPGFYGHGTACGQRYDATILGVASRSLTCGTIVTFEWGGRVVSAPVIDRGPFVGGRTWDLSHGLCEALAHCFTGPIHWRA